MKYFFITLLILVTLKVESQTTRFGFDKILFSSGLSCVCDNVSFEQSLSSNEMYAVPNIGYGFDLTVPIYYLADNLSINFNSFFDYKKSKIQIQTYGFGGTMDYQGIDREKYKLTLSIGGGYLFNSFYINDLSAIESSNIDSTILVNNSQLNFKQSFIAYSLFGVYNEFTINNHFSFIAVVRYRLDYANSDKYIIENKEITLSTYEINKLYLGIGMQYSFK